MSSSAAVDDGFFYPDPSLYGLDARAPAIAPPISAAVDDGFIYPDPSLYGLDARAPAIAPPISAAAPPIPPPRLSAAGLQPFPVLSPGLQAPIELTSEDHIRSWDKNLLGKNPRC